MTDGTEQDSKQEELDQEDLEAQYEKEFNEQWGDGSPEEDDNTVAKPTSTDNDEEDEESEEEHGSSEDDKPDDKSDDVDDPYSWITSLPDEVKAQAESLKHSAEADRGRVAAFNRKLADLRQELDRMKSRQPVQDTAASGGDTPKPAAPELPEEYKQLKEDFPEFADAIAAVREQDRVENEKLLNEKLEPLKAASARVSQQEFDSTVEAAAEKIFDTPKTGVYWKDVAKSEDFLAWLNLQPRSVQTAARTFDPDEAIYVLRQYDSDYRVAVAEMEANQNPDTTEQNDPPNKADKLKADRKKRKAESVGADSKPIIADPDGDGGDYEAQFNAMWGDKKRKKHN